MSGAQEPSSAELESNLVKRILSIRDTEVAKRFNRGGTADLDAVISPSNTTGGTVVDGTAPAVGGADGIPDINTPELTPANPPTAPNSLGLAIEYVERSPLPVTFYQLFFKNPL